MPSDDPLQPSRYLAPRYWPTWLGLGLLRLLVLLPYRVQMTLGRMLGLGLYHLIPRRRRIAETNIRLCFPELDQTAQARLVKENFAATGMAIFEIGLAWWASDNRLNTLHRVENLENFEAAYTRGKGVILLGAHYTTLELSGRLLSRHSSELHPIYKAAKNSLFDALMRKARHQTYDDLLPNSDMRAIIRSIKAGKIVWYAPDQDFGRQSSVFAPFMGIPAATLTTTSRLAKATGAPVIPYFSRRLPEGGYLIRTLPPLENFPSGDDVQDATRINQTIEALVREAPEQYLWLHMRFKTRPNGEEHLYPR